MVGLCIIANIWKQSRSILIQTNYIDDGTSIQWNNVALQVNWIRSCCTRICVIKWKKATKYGTMPVVYSSTFLEDEWNAYLSMKHFCIGNHQTIKFIYLWAVLLKSGVTKVFSIALYLYWLNFMCHIYFNIYFRRKLDYTKI